MATVFKQEICSGCIKIFILFFGLLNPRLHFSIPIFARLGIYRVCYCMIYGFILSFLLGIFSKHLL